MGNLVWRYQFGTSKSWYHKQCSQDLF